MDRKISYEGGIWVVDLSDDIEIHTMGFKTVTEAYYFLKAEQEGMIKWHQ